MPDVCGKSTRTKRYKKPIGIEQCYSRLLSGILFHIYTVPDRAHQVSTTGASWSTGIYYLYGVIISTIMLTIAICYLQTGSLQSTKAIKRISPFQLTGQILREHGTYSLYVRVLKFIVMNLRYRYSGNVPRFYIYSDAWDAWLFLLLWWLWRNSRTFARVSVLHRLVKNSFDRIYFVGPVKPKTT